MPGTKNTANPGIWALLRGEQVQGWYTQLQLQKMTQSGQLLPLDLLRDTRTGEIGPAWKLAGMFPGHGEPVTPPPGSLRVTARLPDYLRTQARGLIRWRSRRMRLAVACLAALGVSLAGPWAGNSPGILHSPAWGLSGLGILAVVFLAWPGRFFLGASIVCAGLALLGAFGLGVPRAGWGFWLGMLACGAVLLAAAGRLALGARDRRGPESGTRAR